MRFDMINFNRMNVGYNRYERQSLMTIVDNKNFENFSLFFFSFE